MTEALKPCLNPWCNLTYLSPSIVITEKVFSGTMRSRVECLCGVKGPMCDTKEAAVAAWNTRSETPPYARLVSALKMQERRYDR